MRRTFGALVAIPDEQWQELQRHARRVDVPKGEILLHEGEPVHWLAFLERGLLRNYQLESVELPIVGLGLVRCDAQCKELIYDGLLNAAFFQRHTVSIDLAAPRAWARAVP